MAGRYHSIDALPPLIGIFPLSGVLLLPRGHLPLNVFEPRYLALVEAALSGSRLIGMIQPTESEEKTLKPQLSSVGCAGRITGYRETETWAGALLILVLDLLLAGLVYLLLRRGWRLKA